LKLLRVSAACIGTLTLAGAAVSARAAGTAPAPFKFAEGVVAAADLTAKTLTIHPAIGDNVTVSVGSSTRFSRGDGAFDPGLPPKAETQAETSPTSGSFVGLYVRAEYDPSTLVAAKIWLHAPVPLHTEGLVHSASDTALSLDLPNGRGFQLALDTNTVCRLNGQPVSGSALTQGDPVAVTFSLKPAENLATLVMARTAPPHVFTGLFVGPGAAANTFSATGGGQTLTFTVDDKTEIRINDKAATLADLQANQPIAVQYRADGSVFLALRVGARDPKQEIHGQENGQGPNTGQGKGTNGGPTTTPSQGKNNRHGKNSGPGTTPSPGPNSGSGTNSGQGTNSGPSTKPSHEPHPQLLAALRALQQAKLHLHDAARDFGGHRAAAATLTDQAIQEVENAIKSDQ